MSPPPAPHVHRVVIEASQSHRGIALWPAPSNHPQDPLRWPRWLKVVALLAAALFNFTANFAASGLSVASTLLELQFRKSASEINQLLTFNFLLLGLGNLFWVPLAVKYGKRAILITSMAMLFAFLCWTAKAKTFDSLLAARCLTGFASSAGESIVPAIVSDLFFLHERAAMMSIYVIFTTSATALGPLIAGYMVQYSSNTWRDYVWLSAAIAGFNFIILVFFYPESNFDRPLPATRSEQVESSSSDQQLTDSNKKEIAGEATHNEELGSFHASATHGVQHVDQVQLSWTSIWFSFFKVAHQTSLISTAVRPLIVLIHPAMIWALFLYGASLGAQVAIVYAFPNLLIPPPYIFSTSQVGLMQVAALIGFIIAMFGGGYLADIITVKRIVREGGILYPEQRLLSLIPGCLIAPAGCILIAFSCSEKLTWVAIAFGFGMVSFGTVYAPNIAITYIVERFADISAEALVIISAFKNLVAFTFLYVAVDWIADQGWVQVFMIMFMLVSLATLLAIPLYIYGERIGDSIEAGRIHQRFLVKKHPTTLNNEGS